MKARAASLLIGLLGSLVLGELFCRFVLGDRVPAHLDERNLAYRYDSQLGWMSVENKQGWYQDTRRISYRNNAEGFRDHPHGAKRLPRMAFLGDSFVWGYDVEQDERFTEKLQLLMPQWEVLNLGVSGYGTDQEYLLLGRLLDLYQPDVVVLVVLPENDREDNSSSMRYEGYYKPYFVVEAGRLRLRGVPVPESMNYRRLRAPLLFGSALVNAVASGWRRASETEIVNPDPTDDILRAMNELLRWRRTRFVVGLIDEDAGIEALCRNEGIEYLRLESPHRNPDNGGHWTADGHAEISRRLFDFFQKGQVSLPALAPR